MKSKILPITILVCLSAISICKAQAPQPFYNISEGDGNGLRFWNSDNYKIHMGAGSQYSYGTVTDYSIKTNMSNNPGRGWTWGVHGLAPIAALNTGGNMQIAGSFKAMTNVSAGNMLTTGAALTNALSTKGIVLGEDANTLEFLNSTWGSGYGAKLYGAVDGSGLTSFRLAVRGNSSTWSDALYIRAADNGSGGGNLGFIGIGTNDPKARLEVHEPTPLGENLGNTKLLFSVGGRSYNYFKNNFWLVRSGSGSSWVSARLHDGISIDGSHDAPGSNTRTWWERDPYSNTQSWGHADQTYMTIKEGDIGIGTNTPSSRLEVVDQNTDLSMFKLKNLAWACNQRTTIEFWNGANKNHATSRIVSQMDGCGADGEALLFETQTAGEVNPSAKLTIKNNGNIGIGTTSPDAKLAVKGTVHAQEVKVDLLVPGPDYVFEPTYNLPTLAETEAYIKANKHLPEVPSAKEMEANGINLSEMNMLLLKKVEELTLHVIELKKENEKQNTLINSLLRK